MIGDGDSSTFGEVKEACEEEYGERYMILKEDCATFRRGWGLPRRVQEGQEESWLTVKGLEGRQTNRRCD